MAAAMAPLVTILPVTTAETEVIEVIEATGATDVTEGAADPQDDHIAIREMKMPMPRVAATETASAKIDTEEEEVGERKAGETVAIENGTVIEEVEGSIVVMMEAGHRDAIATCLMTVAAAIDGRTEESIENAMFGTGMMTFSPRTAVAAVQPLRLRSESPLQTSLTSFRSWSESGA